jgi:RNA polymerase sigma factor (TIGR02999 family)
MTSITLFLTQLQQGETTSDQMSSVVYGELKKLAISRLRRERAGQTLQATALVHEVYLRLMGKNEGSEWRDRRQFFAAATEAMRRILIEQARSKKRVKAGGKLTRLPLFDVDVASKPENWLVDIDDELAALAEVDEDAAEMIKLRVFVGLSLEEAADVIGLSRTNAFRTWTFARAWLKNKLDESKE